MASFVVYIGRDATSEERDVIESMKENDESLYCDYQNSPIKIDGFSVAYEEEYQQHVVCQHYIGLISPHDLDQVQSNGIEYTKLQKPHDSRYKLRIRRGPDI